MRRLLKSVLSCLVGMVLFGVARAQETEYTATNLAVAERASSLDGGTYNYVEFTFTDARNVITATGSEDVVTAENVPERLLLKSVAIMRRHTQSDWPEALTVTLSDGTGAQIYATSAQRTLEAATITYNSTATANSNWNVFAFEHPVLIEKGTLYRATLSSGGKQFCMVKVTGVTDNANTTIHANTSLLFSPLVRLVAEPAPSTVSRTLNGDGVWEVAADATDWGAVGVSAPAEGTPVALNVATDSTLTMNAAASVVALGIEGPGALTFAAGEGEGMALTATTTQVNTDVNATSGVASLGAVTLAAGKTLTLASPAQQSGIEKDAASGSEDSTVRYVGVAPSDVSVTTLAGVNTIFAVPEGTPQTHRLSLTPHGGLLRFESGDYNPLTLAYGGATAATAFEFAGANLNFGEGEFSFSAATVAISGGTISANKMVTSQGGNNYPNTITQTGGVITLTGTDGANGNQKIFMLGHWRQGTSVYNLNGGSLTAENGTCRVGHDSSATLNVAGGTLRVKGINGSGSQTAALNLSSGTVTLGTDGFIAINHFTATLSGGELNAYDSNTIAQALTIAAPAEGQGPAVLSAAADKTMTVSGALTGAGPLTVGTAENAGKVAFFGNLSALTGVVTVAAGELDVQEATLGETTERRFAVGSGAVLTIAQGMEGHVLSVAAAEGDAPAGKLRIPLTEEQRTLTGYFPEGLPAGVHPWYLFEDGTEVDASSLSENGQDFPVQLNTWSPNTPVGSTGEDAGRYAWDNAANWSANRVPTDSANNLRVQLSGDATMVLPAEGTLAFANMEMLGEGTLTIESAGATLAIAENLACELNLVAPADKLTYRALQIAEGKTAALIAAEGVDATVPGAIVGAGTFIKQGLGALTVAMPTPDAEGTLPAAPAITIEAGTLGFSGTGTMATAIAGAGAVSVPAGAAITFTAANTYTGGTTIAETATVSLPAGARLGNGAKTINGTVTMTQNNAALGTGAISGAGTIIVRYSYSGNTDVLANASNLGLTNAAWTGTVQLEATNTTTQGAHLEPNLYGNENSTLAFNGATGWINSNVATTVTAKANLMGEGLTINNGGSSALGKLVLNKVIGDGKLQGTTRANYDYAIILKDVSEFTGAISATDAHNVDTAIIVGEDPAPNGTNLAAYNNYKNKVTVRTGASATIATGKTWTAPGGVVVEERATLSLPAGALLGDVPKVVNGTVNIANANALGTSGAISGAGLIVSTAGFPANRTGLTAEAWTGTLKLDSNLTISSNVGAETDMLALCGNAGSTIELAGQNTGFLRQNGACEAHLVLSGSLTINNGWSGSGYDFNGAFSGSGTLSATGSPSAIFRFNGDTSGFTGTLSIASSSNYGFAFGNIANGTRGAYGTIQVASGKTVSVPAGKTWTAKTGVVVSGTLGGTGTVGSNLTFNEGATLASDGVTPLTAAGAVTFPSAAGAVFTVELPADFAASTEGTPVLAKSGLVAPTKDHYELVRAAGEGAETTAITDAVLVGKADGLYVVKPSVTPPADVELPTADAAAVEDAIAQAAAAEGVLAVTSVVAEEKAQVEGAALFENVVSVQGNEGVTDGSGTATVAYDFGIDGMTISEVDGTLYVVLTARVRNDPDPNNNTADYNAGTQIKVYKSIGGVESEVASAEEVVDAIDEPGVKRMRFPLSDLQTVALSGETTDRGTFNLSVRAVSGDGADTP